MLSRNFHRTGSWAANHFVDEWPEPAVQITLKLPVGSVGTVSNGETPPAANENHAMALPHIKVAMARLAEARTCSNETLNKWRGKTRYRHGKTFADWWSADAKFVGSKAKLEQVVFGGERKALASAFGENRPVVSGVSRPQERSPAHECK